MRYFSIKEFAIELRVHPTTILRSIKFGRIHAMKIGRGKKSVYRIPETEFKRMLDFDLREVIQNEVNRLMDEGKENV